MSENQDIDITSLFKNIEDKLFMLSITNKIEYRRYKESNYIPEIISTAYEEAFYQFPYERISSFDKIKIFYEFYTTDVWGSYGSMKFGDETYKISFYEIADRIKESKSKYIIQKLREKYGNIYDDTPRALIGYKRSEKLPDDHPERNVLINLLNKYREILDNDDLQLDIFNKLFLNKYISDVFTKILIDLIQRRLRLLYPEIQKYKRQPDIKDLSMDSEDEEIIPLFKLNFNLDQQKQILHLVHKRLTPEYFDDSYEQFESHFIKSDIEFEQTVWKGTEREIAHLFKSLKDSKIILSLDQNKLIEIHFLKKNEKPFKSSQLRVAHSQSSIDTFTAIDHLIKDVKKLSAKF